MNRIRIAVVLLAAALALPALAAKPGGTTSTTTRVDFVAHAGAFVATAPTLLSRCSGTATKQYYTEWPRHDLCVFTATLDADGQVVSSDEGVRPFGMEADPGRVKELCNADELCDDPILTSNSKKGSITSLQFYIQDDIGTGGVQFETDAIVLASPAPTNPCGFLVHVHRDGIPVWRLSGHLGGPRVALAGTISIADVWYRPSAPCK